MKTLILSIGLLASLSSFACDGEAQLWPSKIVKIVKTEGSCRAFVNVARMDNNPECALDDYSMARGGIEIGLSSKGACTMDVGQDLSGVLVNKDGFVGLNK